MKMFKALSIAITLLLLMSQGVSAQAPQWKNADYDAVRDFSTQSNPNGVWSYGYLTSWGAPLTLYVWGGTCEQIPGISFWLISPCGDTPHIPLVAHNDTDKPICWLTACIPTTYLWLHPTSELTVLRWTAPSSGKFWMEVKFIGLDCCTTSTYAHVLLNSKRSLLKAPINSYKWPLSFEPRALGLSAGDTLDFIVDWGKDADYNNDSTGAEVKVSKLGQH
jgi:hypothetical protein